MRSTSVEMRESLDSMRDSLIINEGGAGDAGGLAATAVGKFGLSQADLHHDRARNPTQANAAVLEDLDTEAAAGQPAIKGGTKLSMFEGVFVPCVLNIFGVILFLRIGWITGQAGLWEVLLMLAMAFLLVILTTLSMSAVAANGRMSGGGAYYLISRALGPEFGGSIGLIFYAANVFGCSVYLIGFADAFVEIKGISSSDGMKKLSVGVALVILTSVCLVGAEFYAKTSIFVFVSMNTAIIVALLAFLTRATFPTLVSTASPPTRSTRR